MADNKALVKQFFKTFNESYFENLSPLMTPDFVWWTLGSGEVQTLLPKLNILFRDHFSTPFKFKVLDLIAEGDRVVAEAESEGVLKNGTPYNNRYMIKFICEDGKLKRLHEYIDTRYADQTLIPVLRELM